MKRRIFICMVATIAIAACTPKEKTVVFLHPACRVYIILV